MYIFIRNKGQGPGQHSYFVGRRTEGDWNPENAAQKCGLNLSLKTKPIFKKYNNFVSCVLHHFVYFVNVAHPLDIYCLIYTMINQSKVVVFSKFFVYKRHEYNL